LPSLARALYKLSLFKPAFLAISVIPCFFDKYHKATKKNYRVFIHIRIIHVVVDFILRFNDIQTDCSFFSISMIFPDFLSFLFFLYHVLVLTYRFSQWSNVSVVVCKLQRVKR
jgi:hypothetical protein